MDINDFRISTIDGKPLTDAETLVIAYFELQKDMKVRELSRIEQNLLLYIKIIIQQMPESRFLEYRRRYA